ncbi:glycerophosphodiester phosphodiesterase [Desulfococcaceae bacterium HSG9]|nr:glycerophosphodiester phosphodiesterase [Desulfococcaceae bacterium HSG9]
MPLAEIKSVKQKQPFLVAHRGSSQDAPENTLPAFELAWQQGADAIEGDFHLTRDGEIVCVHDEIIRQGIHTQKIVQDSDLDELKLLDVGSRFGKRWKHVRIPTIAEVFQTIPQGKKIYIEIKCGPLILPKLFEELDKSGLTQGQAIIISFNAEVIYQMKRHAPDIKAFFLSNFKKDRQTGQFKPTVEEVLKILQRTHADGFSSKAHKAADETFINRILDNGYEYHVWTIDKVKTATRFIRMGAMSVTTNVPGYLRKELHK